MSEWAEDIGKLLYFYETEHYELYDLDLDLAEANDLLADTPSVSDLNIASSMADALTNWLVVTDAELPTVLTT